MFWNPNYNFSKQLYFLVLLCFLSLVFINPSEGQEEDDIFTRIKMDPNLLKGSRWAVEQAKSGNIIEVYHSIEIVDISKVDVETMSIRIEVHLRQRWEASDLQLPTTLFQPSDPNDTFIRAYPDILKSVWSPDSYIPIARDTKIASLNTEQAIVNIFQNKTMVFKLRLYTILGCAFSFQWYPLDRQICNLTIESYTLPDSMVRYVWETQQPDLVIANLKLLQYDIEIPIFHSNGSAPRWGRGETYPFVYLKLVFSRQLGHHIIQVFIPTTLVVIISWFSFWLGLDAIPGRIGLLITCMLTLVTMHTGLKGAIPPVNYIKMQDIWMVGCMTFVFLSLCEFVIVKFIHWKKQRELKALEEKDKAMRDYMSRMKASNYKTGGNSNNAYIDVYKNASSNGGNDKDSLALWAMGPRPGWPPMGGGMDDFMPMQAGYNNPWNYEQLQQSKPTPPWVRIDQFARFLFPFGFLVFNAVYWPVLIIGASYQDK